MNLKNKTIIVTGASDGIGREIALRLAKDGVNVLLLSRDEKNLKLVQSEIEKIGSKSSYYVCDLKSLEDIKKTVEKISEKYKKIEGLINNAGIWQKKDNLENISDEEIINVLQTNLTGLVLLTKHVMPLLLLADEAILINISSRSGYFADNGQSVYAASKFGVRGFTEVLQKDLKETNIRVGGVYQGGTNTKLFEKAGEDWTKEKYNGFIPTHELAEVVVFMASRPKNVWLSEVRVESK
ncbi:MAG: NAD(P)-dependent oxidoreductase [Candidatus Pacebacteria bacterium CG_4_10_14_3_um_filter_34_15]|nr:SDR family oxidoreductase [Candidatus Pacearchaeota archaeon]NCQ65741.1 SDR family oxidoreductase [Candidatus Paceibacterota bacterium]NCS86362.1 SDR family oxidoreductase [Candidatus Paceibacterota bacterium]PIX81285.1 MAG: NAD(P)-dependent oxidoreductase [Candidatus Pacebacteria bacterium CG_4_10_14_3_um_filter_34_15]